MTSVMPMASSITYEPFRKISIGLPYRLPALVSILKNPGTKIKSNSRMNARATIGKKSLLSTTFFHAKDALVCFMIHSLQLTA
jgi:hypothetical protein